MTAIVLLHCSGQLPQRGLAGFQGFALGLRPLSQSQSSAWGRLRNDYYYPPDDSFASTKPEKASP